MVLGTSASPSLPEAPFLAAAEPRLGARGFRLAAFGFFGAFSFGASFPGSAGSAADASRASSGRIACPVSPATALRMRSERYFANRSLNAACGAAATKKRSMRLWRSAFSHSANTGARSSSARARSQSNASRQNTRSMGRSGLPHVGFSLEVSTDGRAYAWITTSEGNPGGSSQPFFTERCCLKNASRSASRDDPGRVSSATIASSSEGAFSAAAAAAASPSPSRPVPGGAGSAGARSAAGTAPENSARSAHALNSRKPSIPGKAVTISSALTMPTPATPSV